MRNAMRSTLFRAVLGGMAGVGLFLVSAQSRAAGPEKALPANTVAYLKVENAAKLRKEFNASQFGKMLADSAMIPLREDIKSKLEEPNKKLQETFGLTILELFTLPQGTISVALVSKPENAGKGGPPVTMLATADAGDEANRMNDVLTKMTKAAEDKGARIARQTFKDLKLTIIRENDDDKTPVIWAKAGTAFHVATDLDALKEYISNASGRADSLAASDAYRGVMKGIGEDSQVVFFADAQQIISLAIASNPNGNVDQMKQQLKILGVETFKGVGLSFNFNKEEYDQITKLFFYAPGPAEGVLKIFAMPPIELKPQAWVPASVLSYQSFSWNFDKAWKAISELVEQFGAGAIIDQAQRGIDPNGGFDIKKDVIGPLGNRVTILSDLKKPITEKSQRTLFAIELDDEKAFLATFNKLIAVANASPKKRDFQGTTIYDFDPPQLPPGAQMNLDGPVSVAIAKGSLFVATEPTYLEQILRGGTPPLSESAEFQSIARKLPEKNSMLSFDKTEEQARMIYEMVKGEGLQKALDQANANAPGGQKVKNPIDSSKVPEFSVFAKYLGQGGSFGIMDEQGVTITSFSLRKPLP